MAALHGLQNLRPPIAAIWTESTSQAPWLVAEKLAKEFGAIHFQVGSDIGKDGAQSPELKLLVGRNRDVVLRLADCRQENSTV